MSTIELCYRDDVKRVSGEMHSCESSFLPRCNIMIHSVAVIISFFFFLPTSIRLEQRCLPPLCLLWPVYWRVAPTSTAPHRTLLYQEPQSWPCRKGSSLEEMTSNPVRPRSSQCWWTFWSAQVSRWEKACNYRWKIDYYMVITYKKS